MAGTGMRGMETRETGTYAAAAWSMSLSYRQPFCKTKFRQPASQLNPYYSPDSDMKLCRTNHTLFGNIMKIVNFLSSFSINIEINLCTMFVQVWVWLFGPYFALFIQSQTERRFDRIIVTLK
jgi:hypothetical protein